MRNQAHLAYRQVAAAGSPLIRVVNYYDTVLIELQSTVDAIKRKRLDEAFCSLRTATSILQGLCLHLDFDKGGQFAVHMRETYMRLIMSALTALGKPDAVARYDKLAMAIRSLRDAWADAAQIGVQADRVDQIGVGGRSLTG
jgi:flagellin-specific chaperone FliS